MVERLPEVAIRRRTARAEVMRVLRDKGPSTGGDIAQIVVPHLATKTGLEHARRNLEWLLRKELVQSFRKGRNIVWKLTPQGARLINEYDALDPAEID